MASACIHGKEEEECSSCLEQWESALTMELKNLTVERLESIHARSDRDMQRNCALAMGYVLCDKPSEASIDAAREVAFFLMAER